MVIMGTRGFDDDDIFFSYMFVVSKKRGGIEKILENTLVLNEACTTTEGRKKKGNFQFNNFP